MKNIQFFENFLVTPLTKTSPFLSSLRDIRKLIPQLSTTAEIMSKDHFAMVLSESVFITAVDIKTRKIIGMVTLTKPWKPTAFFGTLEDLVVDKKYRHRGIGKTLINMVLKKAKKLKMFYIDLNSTPDKVDANRLYLLMGAEIRDTNVYRFTLSKKQS